MIKKKNIKLDIVNLLNEIQNGKYSNIQLNYYFSKNNYTKKEKMFITNVINVVIKKLIYIDYLIGKSVRNVKKRKIKQLLRISVAQLFFMESDNAGVIFEAGEIAKILNVHQVGFVNATLQKILKNKEKSPLFKAIYTGGNFFTGFVPDLLFFETVRAAFFVSWITLEVFALKSLS